MPTGGVSPDKENLSEWFSAGVTCVGMGSKLIKKDAQGNFDLEKIQSLVQNSIDLIQEIKG